MICPLARCPYCEGCEVVLTDSFDVVVNPDAAPPRSCPHLIWVEGRYSQWGLSPLPGRKTKIARMIGSNEFAWLHPDLAAREDAAQLQAFLRDLAGAGGGWEFAPAAEHVVRPIVHDQNVTEADGRQYPSWGVEASAVFARDAAAFLEGLPGCLERQGAAWSDLPGSAPG